MAKCTFCGGNTPLGRGKMFVRNDGKVLYFCNSKCQKNFRLGRVGKNVKWTHTFRKEIAGRNVAKPPSEDNQRVAKAEKKAE